MANVGLTLALAATLGALAAIELLEEPGPPAIGVLLRRYGAWPFVLGAVGVTTLAGLVFAPAATWLVLAGAAAVVVPVALVRSWGPATWWRAARRCVLRCRWTSVARSSQLATSDKRRVGAGADAAKRWDIVDLEWTPTIRSGRALPHGAGVTYVLTPARGSSLPEIADRAERLAAGLHVAQVRIERDRPDTGRLVVIWR